MIGPNEEKGTRGKEEKYSRDHTGTLIYLAANIVVGQASRRAFLLDPFVSYEDWNRTILEGTMKQSGRTRRIRLASSR